MNLYLTKHRSGVRQDITNLAVSWTWSGDKASLSRQLEMELAFSEKDNLPVPEIGDLVTMEATKPLFAGVVLRRTLGSEGHTLSVTCFDYGIYLQKNDCTAKFTGATPEEITRSLCGDKGIPVAALPTTGISLRRKFSSVKINQAITTVWSLAAEKNGKRYGKNSFDIVILDATKSKTPPVHQYQVKYGADAKATIQLLREHGSVTKYSNQQILVPPEQLDEVRKAFPGKTIVSEIGGTDLPAVFIGVEGKLRMPLHRPDKGLVRHVHRLHQSVLTASHLRKTRGKRLDRLVVVAVDPQFCPAQQRGQRGLRQKRNRMYRPVVGRPHGVCYIRWMLRGQVLIEGAAQAGIEELDAPADPQHRFVLLQRLCKQAPFKGIPLFADLSAGLPGVLTIQHRRDILPSGKEKAITQRHKLRDILFILRQRQGNGKGTG